MTNQTTNTPKWFPFTIIGINLLALVIIGHGNGLYNLESLYTRHPEESSKTEANEEIQEVKTEAPNRISYSEAEMFMRKRFQTLGQSLVEGRTIDLNGTSLHTFISNDLRTGYMCISTVSEYELDVLAADCGPASQKLMEWNSLVN